MSSTLHPDGRLKPSQQVSNDSGNELIFDVIEQRQMSRRGFLKTSLGATTGVVATAVLGTGVVQGFVGTAQAAPAPTGSIGFSPVPANLFATAADDAVTVPPGYTARVLIAWGDSLTRAPNWDPAGAMDEATQLRCYGAHTDGMHFFPLSFSEESAAANSRGLLVTNSEYVDPGLVTSELNYLGLPSVTLGMVRAQQAGHGVNVVDIRRNSQGEWGVVRGSPFNRRITGNTPCKISGPAAGHPLLQTAADPTGTRVLGTLNNCAHGYTPWGTYLTCEENWNGYFANPTGDVVGVPGDDQKPEILSGQSRYGISTTGFGYRWHEADPRFRADTNPNEPNRFGWVVEIDPRNPRATPIKRTAMGRFKHESAQEVVDADNRVAFYMGDDERNEYIYKFVCARPLAGRSQAGNRDMLDSGTLYVAKFNADGTGVWMPLIWGQNGLTLENGFADQGEVLIKTRQAADRLGATMMDRPEWGAAHPVTGEMYMTLTNNNRRGSLQPSSNAVDGTTSAGTARPPVDLANPRPDNDYGHIIRWRDAGGKVTATTFEWDIFVQCGDKETTKTLSGSYNPTELNTPPIGYRGNINGDDFGAPDGLWFDKDGRLWIETDQQGNATGDWVNIGGNAMLCADPSTGVIKRFLTSPKNCEVTGVVSTPDGKTMFVGIQHPGEDWNDPLSSPNINSFTANSTWPDSGINGPTTQSARGTVYKPRSGVVVITKDDGGVIGT
ncbi:MAG TPA: PhoX family phosphatase [Rhodospirillales bacterium]|nr:PhoX family phosphatase [Rhodospirillales bacterium]